MKLAKIAKCSLIETLQQYASDTGEYSEDFMIMCLANLDLNDPKFQPEERQAMQDAMRTYAPQLRAYRQKLLLKGNGTGSSRPEHLA